MKRVRIDQLLSERGVFASRSRAAASVLAGEVLLLPERRRAEKPGQLVPEDVQVELADRPAFVSRGGIKLANALDALRVPVASRHALDVGASTGGFTDCLLQRGAARVAAVDVAYGQIDRRLREDPRVTLIERLNARELTAADLPFEPSLATIDVSFISLTKVLPAVARCLAPGGEVLAMVKPQFELGRERVGKGVVRDPADRREAVLGVALAARELGLPVRGFAPSGLPGPKGNRETFVRCGGEGPGIDDLEAAIVAAEPDA
ncbi:MAG TPA: TlyA family RNA methyltransferase [Solirubrobacteraceae bacterium]|nr:TlyA family RNA methyltransferase [Solirubrobacteraceae bacterium]